VNNTYCRLIMIKHTWWCKHMVTFHCSSKFSRV